MTDKHNGFSDEELLIENIYETLEHGTINHLQMISVLVAVIDLSIVFNDFCPSCFLKELKDDLTESYGNLEDNHFNDHEDEVDGFVHEPSTEIH